MERFEQLAQLLCVCACSLCLPCRPNLLIGGTPAYAEDSWRGVRVAARQGDCSALQQRPGSAAAPAAVAEVVLQSARPCARCDMICADPLTGRWVLAGRLAGIACTSLVLTLWHAMLAALLVWCAVAAR